MVGFILCKGGAGAVFRRFAMVGSIVCRGGGGAVYVFRRFAMVGFIVCRGRGGYRSWSERGVFFIHRKSSLDF